MNPRRQSWAVDARPTSLLGSRQGQGRGRARVNTHLAQGAGQAAELVGCVDGHHGHGGRGDGPAQRVGPLGEDVGSVVRGPEGHDAHHNHKLKPRAEFRRRLSAGGWGEAGPGARVSPEGLPAGAALGARAASLLRVRAAQPGPRCRGWGGGMRTPLRDARQPHSCPWKA